MGQFNNEKLGDITGTRVLVFGGTGGLGRSLSQEFASHGALVTVVGQTFRDKGVENIDFVKADLSSIAESGKVAKELTAVAGSVDIVLFTTGIFAARERQETSEGLERDMAVSYLNRVRILDVLAPRLKKGTKVFILGFPGKGRLGKIEDLNQEKDYNFFTAHMTTVAGNEALVIDAAGQYKDLKIYGINPGLVKTNIRANLLGEGYFSKAVEYTMSWFTPTPEAWAKALAPAFFDKQLGEMSGVSVDQKANLLAASKGMTKEYAHEFVTKSRELISGIN